jgi:hypothetical protein
MDTKISEPETNKDDEQKTKVAMVLFSGGYDSTAVLSSLIEHHDYDTINVVYENIKQAPDGYHDISRNKAQAIYNILTKKAIEANIKITFREIDFDNDISFEDGKSCDALLMEHLTTILNYSGQATDIYLSWNKQHIDALNQYHALDCSMKMLDMMNNILLEGRTIHFLEDIFINYVNELERKAGVIKYLLDRNLFGLCYSYNNLTEMQSGYSACRQQYIDKKRWFFENDEKSLETATALIQTGLFNSKDIVKIFNMKTTQGIQNYYNHIKKQANTKQQ